MRIVDLEVNQGKGAALRVGLAQGRGRYLGFIDGDGDIPARQLSHYLAAIRAADPDVVFGSKLTRTRTSSIRRSDDCIRVATGS